jgi:hypothetical protein
VTIRHIVTALFAAGIPLISWIFIYAKRDDSKFLFSADRLVRSLAWLTFIPSTILIFFFDRNNRLGSAFLVSSMGFSIISAWCRKRMTLSGK